VIGTLIAYYDPEMEKSNNPFCAEGLKGDIIMTSDTEPEITF
jgi:hypothetical protein